MNQASRKAAAPSAAYASMGFGTSRYFPIAVASQAHFPNAADHPHRHPQGPSGSTQFHHAAVLASACKPMTPPGEPMFTRNSTAEPKKLEPIKSNAGPNLSVPQPQPPQRRPSTAEIAAKSVIGNDLKIIGQGLKIISQGTLQVDGEIEGDVGGNEVIIGEKGKVTGTVAAERVVVRGQISGVIRGVTVTLQASSRVEGDIHHMSLAIEQGAEFDGRCRRPANAAELNINLQMMGSGDHANPN
jgi:cytoskeletal protein CcmA (bactofilin family)